MTAHIQVVGWNHRALLEACLASCLRQTVSVPVVYIDNASTDGSADYVRTAFPQVIVVTLTSNRGYSGGHNEGIRRLTTSDVIIVLNPDVVLEADFVERGLSAFTDPRVGAVAPLLLRPGSAQIIDAYGDMLLPTLRAVNQYSGQSLSKLMAHTSRLNQPWGITGAAAFLRRTALEDIALDGEVFDEDLFAYREDVDVSWRLHHRGWRIIGAPSSRASHQRAVTASGAKPARIAQLSWRNYFLVLTKNLPFPLGLRHALPLSLEMFARWGVLLIRPRLWPVVPEYGRLVSVFRRKRQRVLSRRVDTNR